MQPIIFNAKFSPTSNYLLIRPAAPRADYPVLRFERRAMKITELCSFTRMRIQTLVKVVMRLVAAAT
jgi:hypothetical protein